MYYILALMSIYVYSYIEKGCRKNCARDNQVIWDMINALFLTL